MASLAAASVTIPSFPSLKASIITVRSSSNSTFSKAPTTMIISARASLKEVGVAVAATAASAIIASNALAFEVLLGEDGGGLVFVPSEFSVPAGETIVFKNNAGFPHNVVFDEDEVPPGVNAASISMAEDDLLNGPGETFSVTLKDKGTYSFYCAPHQGAGMVGKVTVK